MTIKPMRYGMYTALGVSALLAGSFATGIVKPKEVQQAYERVKPIIEEKLARTPVQKPAEIPSAKSKPSPPKVAVEKKPSVVTAKKKTAEPKNAVSNFAPTFDVLRVEKNGSILVAGRAGPKQKVELALVNGTVLGSTRADPGGDFVILPTKSLEPGDYVLTLRAFDQAGNTITSSQTSIIHVPKSGGEVLAMISRSGEATRITIKPESLISKNESNEISEGLKSVPKAKPVEKATTISPPAPRIIVEAVEMEGNKIYIAGEVEHKSLVRIYIDNKILGSTRGTGSNRFLLTKTFSLEPGEHVVRADVIDRKTGSVLSRAEVPLHHELPKLALTENKTVDVDEPKQPPPENQTVVKTEETEESNSTKIIKPRDEVKKLDKLKNKVAKHSAPDDNQKKPNENTIEKPIETTRLNDPKPIRTGTTIIIKPGDNLWKISRRTYGRGIRYTTIYNANRDQIRNPSKIYVGQVFKIPEKAE